MNHECNILAYSPLTHMCASASSSAIAMPASKYSLIVNNAIKSVVVVVAII